MCANYVFTPKPKTERLSVNPNFSDAAKKALAIPENDDIDVFFYRSSRRPRTESTDYRMQQDTLLSVWMDPSAM
jgi:hypothetical protein